MGDVILIAIWEMGDPPRCVASVSVNGGSPSLPSPAKPLPPEPDGIFEDLASPQPKLRGTGRVFVADAKSNASYGQRLHAWLVDLIAPRTLSNDGQSRRIWLDLRVAPECANRPWELMHVPMGNAQGVDAVSGYLACSDTSSVSRRSGEPTNHVAFLRRGQQIKVLVIRADAGEPAFESETENQKIHRASGSRWRRVLHYVLRHTPFILLVPRAWIQKLRVRTERLVSAEALEEVVEQFKPHVVHFIAHGVTEDQAGAIILSRPAIAGEPASQAVGNVVVGEDVSDLLGDRQRKPLLVVLTACETAVQPGDYFSSVAATLVGKGVPFVVGMQASIGDRTAERFSKGFYTRLQQDGDVDAAAAAARTSIKALGETKAQFASPVLYHAVGPRFTLYGSPDDRKREIDWSLVAAWLGVAIAAVGLALAFPGQMKEWLPVFRQPSAVATPTPTPASTPRYSGNYNAMLDRVFAHIQDEDFDKAEQELERDRTSGVQRSAAEVAARDRHLNQMANLDTARNSIRRYDFEDAENRLREAALVIDDQVDRAVQKKVQDFQSQARDAADAKAAIEERRPEATSDLLQSLPIELSPSGSSTFSIQAMRDYGKGLAEEGGLDPADSPHPWVTPDATAALGAAFVLSFDTSSKELRDSQNAKARMIASILTSRDYDDLEIEVIGKADARGDDASNRQLSEERMQTAVDALISAGLPSSRLKASAVGETWARGDEKSVLAGDRAVEIRIRAPGAGNILFDKGSSELSGAAVDQATAAAEWAIEHPDEAVLVEGHTDITPIDGGNYQLGLRRAEAIREALVQAGVAKERIVIFSFGATRPVHEKGDALDADRRGVVWVRPGP